MGQKPTFLLSDVCEMTEFGVIEKASKIAEPVLASFGMELVDVEYKREQQGWVLRLYIDKEDGVTLDDCSAVSREVGAVLEIEDIIDHHYNLEVSSPGLTRPLKKLSDFERFKGRHAKIKLYALRDGKKTFTGKIAGVEGDEVIIDADGQLIRFKHSDIAKANLEYTQEG